MCSDFLSSSFDLSNHFSEKPIAVGCGHDIRDRRGRFEDVSLVVYRFLCENENQDRNGVSNPFMLFAPLKGWRRVHSHSETLEDGMGMTDQALGSLVLSWQAHRAGDEQAQQELTRFAL